MENIVLTDEQQDDYIINFVGEIYNAQYDLWMEQFGKLKFNKRQLSFDMFYVGYLAGLRAVMDATDDEKVTHKAILKLHEIKQ